MLKPQLWTIWFVNCQFSHCMSLSTISSPCSERICMHNNGVISDLSWGLPTFWNFHFIALSTLFTHISCGVFVFKWQPYRDWVVAKKRIVWCVWTQHNIGNDTLSFIEAHVTWMFQIIILTPLFLPFPISHEIRYDHILNIFQNWPNSNDSWQRVLFSISLWKLS